MQYAASAASAASAADANDDPSRRQEQILAIGLTKFPGSALLHLRAAVVALQRCSNQQEGGAMEAAHAIAQAAVKAVGQGSHRNEGKVFVADLYRILAQTTANNDAVVGNVFVQRAAVPMNDNVNSDIVTELQEYYNRHNNVNNNDNASPEVLQQIEDNRRWVAQTFEQYVTYEDDIDVAMQAEGILARHLPEFNHATTTAASHLLDWDTILSSSTTKNYGMGLGAKQTATAFIHYAKALLRHKTSNANLLPKQLALSVYERGVAECPTVEALWLAYIQDLQKQPNDNAQLLPTTTRLQSVIHRAVRNCPYSVALLQQQLCMVLELSSVNNNTCAAVIVDPDELLEMVDKAVQQQFILPPNNSAAAAAATLLDLYSTAIRVVKRRILVLIASSSQSDDDTTASPILLLAYDDAEAPPSKTRPKTRQKSSSSNIDDDDILQEIQDLVEDLPDMYDAVDSRLVDFGKTAQNRDAANYCRALLGKERAQSQAFLLHPLQQVFALKNDHATSAINDKSQQQQLSSSSLFEKCIKLYNPPHPDMYAAYIHHQMAMAAAAGAAVIAHVHDVLSRLRRIRYTFQQAIAAVGTSKQRSNNNGQQPATTTTLPLRDYESALTSLGNEWLDFERLFGSEQSLGKAANAVERKLKKAARSSSSRRRQYKDSALSEAAATVVPPSKESVDDVASGKKHRRDSEDRVQEKTFDSTISPQLAKKRKTGDSTAAAATTTTTTTAEENEAATATTEIADDAMKKNLSTNDKDDNSAKKKKSVVHKVRVGTMEYPAHPYTVRVSNLSPDTQDMDLVDLFRPKCGAIVHAKIMREKTPLRQGRWQ